MQGTVVGVLRGGPSREHDVSLKSGAAIISALPEGRFTVRDIYIDKEGVWHDRGRVVEPSKALHQIDVALLGLHGEYGEDGQVQRLLERHGVRYAGADSFASHLAMHKLMAKARAKDIGLLTPEFRYIQAGENIEAVAHDVTRNFPQPVIVKPVGWGSSVGISRVGGYAPLYTAIDALFKEGAPAVLIEEMIRGREATAGVVEGLRGKDLYSLPVVEIVPPSGDFFSHAVKYDGSTNEICPGNFSRVTTEELQRAAKIIHTELGIRHYSRSDFIVSPRGIYYLETNTLPGLTSESLMPKSLAAVGVSLPEFLAHLVTLALSR